MDKLSEMEKFRVGTHTGYKIDGMIDKINDIIRLQANIIDMMEVISNGRKENTNKDEGKPKVRRPTK